MQTLSTEEIGKSYRGRRVVNGVSLAVNRGEVVGLLGPNGAGKTTSFYMIVGLIPPDYGAGDDRGRGYHRRSDVFAGAHSRHQLSSAGGFGLSQAERGGEHSGGAGDAKLHAGEERRSKLESLLDQLGLGHIRKNKGYALSGGERRRVEIARALCINPTFILLDEPFSGIDPIAVLDLQKIIFSAEGERDRSSDHRPQCSRNAFGGGPGLHHQRGPHLPHRNSGAARQRSGGQASLPG